MNAFTTSALPSQLNNGNFITRPYSMIANIVVAAVAVAVVAVVALTGSCRIMLRSRVFMLYLAI
ncbi:hypothetical protein IPF37_01075 [bacterium]|nr:MAG: hypothetical protein IPF37_01075 [bacterium]